MREGETESRLAAGVAGNPCCRVGTRYDDEFGLRLVVVEGKVNKRCQLMRRG